MASNHVLNEDDMIMKGRRRIIHPNVPRRPALRAWIPWAQDRGDRLPGIPRRRAGTSPVKEMTIHILKQLSKLFNPGTRSARDRRHLVLAGIQRETFLAQWGSPAIMIDLEHLEGLYEPESVALKSGPNDDMSHSVRIYPKHDRIFFFTNNRLSSHFRWSAFKEKTDSLHYGDPGASRTSTPALLAGNALSLVA
jgi:hypothetical protein